VKLFKCLVRKYSKASVLAGFLAFIAKLKHQLMALKNVFHCIYHQELIIYIEESVLLPYTPVEGRIISYDAKSRFCGL